MSWSVPVSGKHDNSKCPTVRRDYNVLELHKNGVPHLQDMKLTGAKTDLVAQASNS